MRRRLPPLKTLPAFEIAADRLSFSEAAGELHLTHGAVSRQIKTLETALGVALFRRRNRRIELTEAGLALLPGVREALQLLEACTVAVATSPRQGALVVSCVATFMMRWLIPRLYDFNALHRAIEIRLSAMDAPIDFARNGIDIAIRRGKPPWPRNVIASPFLADRVGPVCAPALLKGRNKLRVSDLRHYKLLHAETSLQAWSDWARHVDAAGVDIKKSQGFEHTYFMLETAASGLGIGHCVPSAGRARPAIGPSHRAVRIHPDRQILLRAARQAGGRKCQDRGVSVLDRCHRTAKPPRRSASKRQARAGALVGCAFSKCRVSP
jgi:LysR family transcriptional regulator, glycine cleavage system transcriptional activator